MNNNNKETLIEKKESIYAVNRTRDGSLLSLDRNVGDEEEHVDI